jgi:hypothetical protein
MQVSSRDPSLEFNFSGMARGARNTYRSELVYK